MLNARNKLGIKKQTNRETPLSEELESLSASRTFRITDGAIEELVLAASEERVLASKTVIDSKYEIKGLIGRGGMGAVYNAYHLSLKKDVALKTFRHGLMSSGAFMRFQREVKALAKVRSENVIQIFDFGIDAHGIPYYTMELLDGFSLADRLNSQGTLEIDETISIFTQVASALSKAHALGIVHRDIKPANIFLVPRNDHFQVKVLDFGIAKILGSETEKVDSTRTGLIFGSPLYMSPEQIRGEDADHTTDIYSFGCALFEALTGKPPYVGNSCFETMRLHQEAAIPALATTSKNEFPSVLEDLITRALAKDKSDRFSSFSEVLNILPSVIVHNSLFDSNADVEPLAESVGIQAIKKTSTASIPGIAIAAGLGLLVLTCVYVLATNVLTVEPPKTYTIKTPINLVADTSSELELKRLDSLKVPQGETGINFNDAIVTKANLAYIAKQNQLRKIRLYRCEIDNSGLEKLSNLSHLSELNLAHSNLDDQGAISISSCAGVTSLRADATQIKDSGMTALARMKRIGFLDISNTKISAQSLSKLNCSKTLRVLVLSGTAVSESSIRSFCRRNPFVTTIYIKNCTQISEETAKKLQAEFPTRISCEVLSRKNPKTKEAIEGFADTALDFSEGKTSEEIDGNIPD